MRYFSMFSGIGGFELGISNAMEQWGYKQEKSNLETIISNSISQSNERQYSTCIGYSEIDKYAIKVYERHFTHKNYGDATTIDPNKLPDFDLLVGGFPCQAFSVAGKRKGFNDTRGTLFFDIARILSVKNPKHLVLENVKGLLSHDQGRTFQTIIGVLSDLGYGVEWQVLNSKDFGVPQNRERVIIIGHLRGECGRKVFPIKTNDRQINKVWNTNHNTYRDSIDNKSSLWKSTERRTIYRTPLRYLNRNQRNIKGDYAFTVDASQTSGIKENDRIRRLTPKECERLQGFPDDWTVGESDTQRYKMCGNAITVNVIQNVIERLIWEE